MYLIPSKIIYDSPKEVAWARQQLFAAWGIKPPRRQLNPAAQPLSLHRSELKEVVASKQKYVASLKADGVRYLLLLTKEVVNNKTEHVALMFDRKLIPYEVSLWAPAHMFELGSVLTVPATSGKEQVSCQIVDNLILQNLDKSGKSYIIECTMELKMEKRMLLLFPIGLRHDKSAPNQLTTVESTIENVIEHIDIEELLDEVCSDVF